MSRAFDLDDVLAIEGVESDDETTHRDYYLGLQRAINGGHWSLQGSYGRTMMAAIESGHCMLGEQRARDYWGNTIPARTDVQAGTKGSPEFVEENIGAEWRAAMEAA